MVRPAHAERDRRRAPEARGRSTTGRPAAATWRALARRRQVDFAELLDLHFVGLPRGTALDGHLAMQAARLGRMLRLRVRVSSLDAVCAMVAAGVGAGIVPEATARRQRRGLPLGVVRIAEPWANRQLMLCVRDSKRLSRPARKLFDALRS
ncbi:MAG: hypothetical protein GEV13_12435 [Rhodospirillales bacterium]|nr:hypothetical protein [Rhodospirillales bacterium]